MRLLVFGCNLIGRPSFCVLFFYSFILTPHSHSHPHTLTCTAPFTFARAHSHSLSYSKNSYSQTPLPCTQRTVPRSYPISRMTSKWMRLFAIWTAAVLQSAARQLPEARPVAGSKPHIIWIVVDDLGWADVSWRSGGQTLTPNLDSLRRTGVELTNLQTYKFCTPTRSSFLTGRLPFHTLQKLTNIPKPPACATALQLNYTLLPELLRSQGYHCSHVGKWHLGAHASRYLPTSRGFDESLAYLCISGGYDHFTQTGSLIQCPGVGGAVDLWLNDGPARHLNGTYDATMYTAFAVDVIKRHAQRQNQAPLYLHLEYHVVHEPIQSPAAYQARYPHVTNKCRKAYCGMISAMDDGVGNVTSALKKYGLYDNALLIVTSDNGALVDAGGCGSNWPLRGGKKSFFAGGIQGVALVHSPSLLPATAAGTVFSGLSHAADFYPTLAALAGVDAASLVDSGPFPVDGEDLWPFLSGAQQGNPHDELLVSGCRPGTETCNGALFVGELKLIVGKQTPAGWYRPVPNGTTTFVDTVEDDCSANPCLFNTTADPHERVNLATTEPGQLARLMDRFSQLSNHTVPEDPPSTHCSTAAVCAAVIQNKGFFGPWDDIAPSHNRSCACPLHVGYHFSSSGGLLVKYAGGNASTCRRHCCDTAGCGGWVHTSYQVKGSAVCPPGGACCYLWQGQGLGSLEPKANCTAGLVNCSLIEY